MGEKARAGDGVIAGAGRVDGRPVFCYAQDPSYLGGSLGEQHAESIVRVLRLAGRAGAPVVGFIESGGARMQEGLAALAGYARIFKEHVALSGKIPQISVICGASAGGGSYSPALTDFVVMTERGEHVPHRPRGREGGHGRGRRRRSSSAARRSTTATASRTSSPAPTRTRRCSCATCSTTCPRTPAAQVPVWRSAGPVGYDPGDPVPESERQVYDVRDVVRGVVDGGRLLEWGPRWARNIVCGFARMDGKPVGIVANQPKFMGGVLDSESATKGAKFVRTCNAFGIPLLVFVDTPGFMPGTKQEKGGVIRHGAKLVHAFAEASVPKITLVLRKAFGGAFIAMNSRDLGADYVFAWPQATLGVMGAKQAVGIVKRRDIAAADDPEEARGRFAREYTDEHLTSAVAAAEGYVDEIVPPADTRRRLTEALRTLEAVAHPAHGVRNIPL